MRIALPQLLGKIVEAAAGAQEGDKIGAHFFDPDGLDLAAFVTEQPSAEFADQSGGDAPELCARLS
jgi:hypothetical protein